MLNRFPLAKQDPETKAMIDGSIADAKQQIANLRGQLGIYWRKLDSPVWDLGWLGKFRLILTSIGRRLPRRSVGHLADDGADQATDRGTDNT